MITSLQMENIKLTEQNEKMLALLERLAKAPKLRHAMPAACDDIDNLIIEIKETTNAKTD